MAIPVATEVLRLKLKVWHPDCWTLQVTSKTDAGLFGHGAFTTNDGLSKGRFTVYGDSTSDVEALIEETLESPLTYSVNEIQQGYNLGGTEMAAPGNATREIFVEFESENSIDPSIISRGFVYDGPVHIYNGFEYWTVVAHEPREEVKNLLEEIKDECDAEIEVLRVSPYKETHGEGETIINALSARQREIFELAYSNGYYNYPRETTSRELAEKVGISKTTLLEHLRKSEMKIFNNLM